MIRKPAIILLLLLGATCAFAGISNALAVEANVYYGKTFPMYPSFPKTTYAQSYELNFSVRGLGKRQWHQLYNYPRFGMSFYFTDLGNPKELGQQITFVPTIAFPMIRKPNSRCQFDIKMGMGLCYFTRIYDSISNPHNYSAGAHFTWQVNTAFLFRYALAPSAFLQLGGIWMHSSNSHTVLPNVGINTFALSFGLVDYPFRNNEKLHHFDTVRTDKLIKFNFRFGVGWQDRGGAFGPIGGRKWPVYVGAVYISKRVAHILKLNTGFRYQFYQNYYDYIVTHNTYTSFQKLKASAFVWFLGGEILMGHIAFNLEPGINLYKPFYKVFFDAYEKSNKVQYWQKQILAMRIGMQVYLFNPDKHIHNNAFLGCFVNANSGQAEFMEFTMGYVF